MNLLKIIAHYWPILNKNNLSLLIQNFVISIRRVDFFEKLNKIIIKGLKKLLKIAFTHLSIIFSSFHVKIDQSQYAFFRNGGSISLFLSYKHSHQHIQTNKDKIIYNSLYLFFTNKQTLIHTKNNNTNAHTHTHLRINFHK